MGILISRFRKKKTTIEILEDLDKEIKEIQQYGQNTEQRHKRIVGTLILCSVALYTITAVIFYFYFFPASLYDQLFYIIPLLIFPLLILFTKKMVSWYYKRKISRNQDKLESLQNQKKKVLDDVTETETYKKAKEILMKFAPDQLKSPSTPEGQRVPFNRGTSQSSYTGLNNTPLRSGATPSDTATVPAVLDGSILRRRAVAGSTAALNTQLGKFSSTTASQPFGPAAGVTSPPMSPFQTRFRQFGSPIGSPARNPLPRPILSQQRSYFDRLVEYLVGDGPSNRYALICRQCESHNGMALKEEFEYFAFRCCYCNFWNPARKQKPSAPKLNLPNTSQFLSQSSADLSHIKQSDLPSSKSENSINLSESDSDIEVVEKPNENEEDIDEKSSRNSDNEEITFEKNREEPSEKMEVDESSPK